MTSTTNISLPKGDFIQERYISVLTSAPSLYRGYDLQKKRDF